MVPLRVISFTILLWFGCSNILRPSPLFRSPSTSNPVKFDPYVDNGGTAVGIAGRDYVILATDTRLSDKYSIKSREISKIFQVDKSLLVGSGCWADAVALHKDLSVICASHKVKFGFELPAKSFASLLSNILYKRRLSGLLYYSFCITGGLDEQGHGCLWKFDCAGSYQPVVATCTGRGEAMIQPMLDQITSLEQDEDLWEFCENVKSKQEKDSFHKDRVDIPLEEARALVIKAFQAAAEREITIGDGVEMIIMRHRPSSTTDITTTTTETESEPLESNSRSISYVIEKQFIPLPRH